MTTSQGHRLKAPTAPSSLAWLRRSTSRYSSPPPPLSPGVPLACSARPPPREGEMDVPPCAPRLWGIFVGAFVTVAAARIPKAPAQGPLLRCPHAVHISLHTTVHIAMHIAVHI